MHDFNRDIREISLYRSRLKKDLSSSSILILVLILSCIYLGPDPPVPILLLSQPWFWSYSSLSPDPILVLALVLVLSHFHSGPGCIHIPVLSRCCPGSIHALVKKENLVPFRVPDALWLSLDNDFPSVLEEYLWHMSCDNMAFDRNFRWSCKLLFLTKNCWLAFWWKKNRSRFRSCSNPRRKLWFRNYFAYLYLNHFYISLEGKSLRVKHCSRFETSLLKTWLKKYYRLLNYARIPSINK